MTTDQIEITFRVTAAEASALLRFLRRISRDEVKEVLDFDYQEREFDAASERLRVALRDKLEPGWRERE